MFAGDMFGYEQPVLRGDGDGALVEQLMVQGAQRQAVGDDVRAVVLNPFDVRCFQADYVFPQINLPRLWSNRRVEK